MRRPPDPSERQPAASHSSFHCIRLCDAVHRRANNHDFILFKNQSVIKCHSWVNRSAIGWYKDGPWFLTQKLQSEGLGSATCRQTEPHFSSLRGHDMMLVSVCVRRWESSGSPGVQRWVLGLRGSGVGRGASPLAATRGHQ